MSEENKITEKNKIEKYVFVGNDQQIGKMTLRKNAIIEEKTYKEIMKIEENKELESLFVSLENFNDYKRSAKAFSGTSMKKFKKKKVKEGAKEEKKEETDAPKGKGGKK